MSKPTFLKSLLQDFRNRRPSSTVEQFNDQKLDVEVNGQLVNVCPFYVISTDKVDYDGNSYQDFVLYDSTGEGPIYKERNYEKRLTPAQWFKRISKEMSCYKFRVSYLIANLIDEEI